MTKRKIRQKYAQLKRIATPSKQRCFSSYLVLNAKIDRLRRDKPKEEDEGEEIRDVAKTSTALYFQYNMQLGPPYHVIIDTNFIHFSIKNKVVVKVECHLYITDCVMGELETMGTKYRIGLKLAKDPKIKRLPCTHKGIYADDCICNRVTQHKCYIVATCDRDLRRRIRKIPGVPIMYIMARKYTIERLPEATLGGAPRV